MAKFLANENVPGEVVAALRLAGYDVAWIVEISPGSDDDAVLAMSLTESRVLLTFDKDFGEMAFRQGKDATCGVLLLREPDYLARFAVAVLAQPVQWEGYFCVAREGMLRTVRLR